jgi:hypothetical protein
MPKWRARQATVSPAGAKQLRILSRWLRASRSAGPASQATVRLTYVLLAVHEQAEGGYCHPVVGVGGTALARFSNRADTPSMAFCGSTNTDDGKPCENPVRPGERRCWRHGGSRAPSSGGRRTTRPKATASRTHRPTTRLPGLDTVAWQSSAPAPSHRQPPSELPPSRRVLERERVKEAADFCADSLSGSWQEAVADRATDYAQTTWARLSRSRRKRNCKKLARMAREILEARDQIHTLAGELAGAAANFVGVKGAGLDFTKELAANIPLPTDAKMIAVARGIQVAGILLCVMDSRDLTRCECFIDMAKAEAKERVDRILVAAMSDWVGLARFGPQAARSV